MIKKMRVEFLLNESEIANLFWDGANHIYSAEELREAAQRGDTLPETKIRKCITQALRHGGQDSVCCGPTSEQNDTEEAWSAAQVKRLSS